MTTDERILTALLCGPMTSGQVAKGLMRSPRRIRPKLFVLRSRGYLMGVPCPNSIRPIPAYALTAKGLALVQQLLSNR
jgi:predicted ArsR family transcriptional regulator